MAEIEAAPAAAPGGDAGSLSNGTAGPRLDANGRRLDVVYDRYGFVTDSGDINASSSGAPVSAAAAATDGPGARRQRTKSRRHPPLIPNADGDFTPEQLAIMRRREAKWMTMLNNWQWWMQHRGNKIKSRCRKGIPRTLRGKAWRLLCGSVERRQAEEPLQSGLFDQLADRADQLPADHALQEFLEIIERDLDRTFPHHDFFREKGGSGQQELRRLLRAYAVYNPALGYCQGMGMVAGALLMQMPVEEAFWVFVMILEKYIPGFYDSGLKAVQIASTVLHGLIRSHLPHLYAILNEQGMTPIMYFTDWMMCCFVKTLPWESVLRVWDMFFFEGIKTFYRCALAILALNEAHMLANCREMHEQMLFLRALPRETLEPDVLLPKMLSLRLKRREIEHLHKAAEVEYAAAHPPKPAESKRPSSASVPAAAPPTATSAPSASPPPPAASAATVSSLAPATAEPAADDRLEEVALNDDADPAEASAASSPPAAEPHAAPSRPASVPASVPASASASAPVSVPASVPASASASASATPATATLGSMLAEEDEDGPQLEPISAAHSVSAHESSAKPASKQHLAAATGLEAPGGEVPGSDEPPSDEAPSSPPPSAASAPAGSESPGEADQEWV